MFAKLSPTHRLNGESLQDAGGKGVDDLCGSILDQRHLTSTVGLSERRYLACEYGEVMFYLYNRDNILNYKSIKCEIRESAG